MNVKVYNQDGQEVGSVDLNPDVFEVEPREAVVHQYVVNFLARQRQGTHKAKERSEVRGGGRKPWRQKGTGRARVGTIRSPLWRGGGIVFGPQPRSYGSKFPRKMKRLAIKSILSDKARNERIKVIDKIEFPQIKTRQVINLVNNFELAGKKCLVVDEGHNDNLVLSCRNIPEVAYSRAAVTSGYAFLNADYVLMTRAALDKVQEVFA